MIFKKNFQSKSNSITNVFTKTQAKLDKLTAAIVADTVKKEDKIAKLQAELDANVTLISQHNTVIANINKILN